MTVMRYGEMKDSGVPWFGVMPAHWSIRRLKKISPRLNVGIVINPTQYISSEGLPFIYGGDIKESYIDWEHSRRITPEDSLQNKKTILELDDILTVRVGYPGVSAVVTSDCVGGNCASVMLIKHGNFNSKWLCYCMNSDIIKQQINIVKYGAAQEQFNISHATEFIVPTPSELEQTAIATYLDGQCGQIDDIISSTKSVIEEYKQWKASVIFEAVTKGLDPSVPMKDSGVVWIGEMPEHWRIIKNKHIFKENVRSITKNDIPLSLSQKDGLIYTNDMKESSLKTSTYENWKHVIPGDLVINRFKGHLGVMFASTLEGMVSFHYGVFEPISDIETKYYEYLYHTNKFCSLYAVLSNGVTVGLQNLSNTNFYKVYTIYPPLSEQQTIVSYLDTRCSEIDSIIAEKESLIADLESYKKSLIYETVTGKRKVA